MLICTSYFDKKNALEYGESGIYIKEKTTRRLSFLLKQVRIV